MVDPSTIVVEDEERGIRARVLDVKLEWKEDRKGSRRPRIEVKYEVNGKKKRFYFTLRVETPRRVKASVALDEERALVLATLTGDETLREKRGTVSLYASHLLALAKYKGVGWELLYWYIKATARTET